MNENSVIPFDNNCNNQELSFILFFFCLFGSRNIVSCVRACVHVCVKRMITCFFCRQQKKNSNNDDDDKNRNLNPNMDNYYRIIMMMMMMMTKSENLSKTESEFCNLKITKKNNKNLITEFSVMNE